MSTWGHCNICHTISASLFNKHKTSTRFSTSYI